MAATACATPCATPCLPPDVVLLVFEALPARDRLACRLVCRAWAMVPLEAARASRSAAPRLLRRLAGMPAAWISKPRARFDLLRLDLAWRSVRLADVLGAALAAPSCARLAHLSLGDLRGDAGQAALDAVGRAAPRLRTLVIGAAFEKPWTFGTLRFRVRGMLPELRALRVTAGTGPRSTTLYFDVPLPAVETACLRNVWHVVVVDGALPGEARLTCFDANSHWLRVQLRKTGTAGTGGAGGAGGGDDGSALGSVYDTVVPVPRMNQPFLVADLLAASRL